MGGLAARHGLLQCRVGAFGQGSLQSESTFSPFPFSISTFVATQKVIQRVALFISLLGEGASRPRAVTAGALAAEGPLHLWHLRARGGLTTGGRLGRNWAPTGEGLRAFSRRPVVSWPNSTYSFAFLVFIFPSNQLPFCLGGLPLHHFPSQPLKATHLCFCRRSELAPGMSIGRSQTARASTPGYTSM